MQVSASTVEGPIAGRDVNIGAYFQHGQSQSATSDHRSVPTPTQIATDVNEATPYLRNSVASSYSGLKIHWKMQIENLRFMTDKVDLTLKSDSIGPYVIARVNLTEYPILKIFRGGEPVDVVGTILWVQPENGMIHLEDVTLSIPK